MGLLPHDIKSAITRLHALRYDLEDFALATGLQWSRNRLDCFPVGSCTNMDALGQATRIACIRSPLTPPRTTGSTDYIAHSFKKPHHTLTLMRVADFRFPHEEHRCVGAERGRCEKEERYFMLPPRNRLPAPYITVLNCAVKCLWLAAHVGGRLRRPQRQILPLTAPNISCSTAYICIGRRDGLQGAFA